MLSILPLWLKNAYLAKEFVETLADSNRFEVGDPSFLSLKINLVICTCLPILSDYFFVDYTAFIQNFTFSN